MEFVSDGLSATAADITKRDDWSPDRREIRNKTSTATSPPLIVPTAVVDETTGSNFIGTRFNNLKNCQYQTFPKFCDNNICIFLFKL